MKKFLVFSLITLVGPTLVFAQNFGIQTQSFNLEIEPKFPDPLSEVRAKVTSFTFDADRASYQWTLNGKIIQQGTGAKEASFKVGQAGSLNSLKVIISAPDGTRLERTLEIYPNSIDLLVESSSFIPPWYKGAALVTPFGRVKIAAVPNFIFEGKRLDPKTLVYNWRVDDIPRSDLSGRGRQSITIPTPSSTGGQIKVSVKISSPVGTLEQEASTFVEARRPEILFYERRALEGTIISQALSPKTIPAGGELEVQAVPFYMNFSSLSELNFLWKVDGQKVISNSEEEPNILYVKPQEGSASQNALVSLTINNLKRVLEVVTGTFNIQVQ